MGNFMSRTKLPKYITQHPAVAFADTGDNQGSDYKWYVELKPGFVFERGRNEGCSSLFFHNREDFEWANPIATTAAEVK